MDHLLVSGFDIGRNTTNAAPGARLREPRGDRNNGNDDAPG
jgi:hypothetical protein